MVRSGQKRAHRRALSRHGKSVEMTHYEITSEGDAERTIPTKTAGSPYTVTARAFQIQRPSRQASARDQGDVDIDRVFLVADDADGIDELTGSAGEDATEIVEEGETYYVLDDDPQDNGLLRLETRKD